MSPSAITLMDKIMEPASWLTTILYKPIYVFQAMIQVIPFLIKTRLSVTKPRVFNFVQALRTSAPPFPTNDLKIGAAGFWYVFSDPNFPSTCLSPEAYLSFPTSS